MSRSNLTEAVAAVGCCSDDELRQLQALISARLDGGSARTSRGRPGKKVDGGKRKAKSQPKGGGETSTRTNSRGGPKKGNPQRKSQYATHPVYAAYRAARKAAEAVARKEKVSLKLLTGDAKEKYVEAISAWLQTKSGFRASKKDHEMSGSESDSSQGRKAKTGAASSEDGQVSPVAAPPRKRVRMESASPSWDGKKPPRYGLPPRSWTEEFPGEDWNSLPRNERKRIWRFQTKPSNVAEAATLDAMPEE